MSGRRPFTTDEAMALLLECAAHRLSADDLQYLGGALEKAQMQAQFANTVIVHLGCLANDCKVSKPFSDQGEVFDLCGHFGAAFESISALIGLASNVAHLQRERQRREAEA